MFVYPELCNSMSVTTPKSSDNKTTADFPPPHSGELHFHSSSPPHFRWHADRRDKRHGGKAADPFAAEWDFTLGFQGSQVRLRHFHNDAALLLLGIEALLGLFRKCNGSVAPLLE